MDFSGQQVNVNPTQDHHQWFMTIEEVAAGYGIDRVTVMRHLTNHSEAFRTGIEKGVQIMNTPGGPQEKIVLYRQGVIMLGFHVRSPKALAFQRWATEIVIDHLDKTGTTMDTVLQRLDTMQQDMNQRFDQMQGEVDELREILHFVLSDTDEKTIRDLMREVKTTLKMDGRTLVGHVRGLLGTSGIYNTRDARSVINILKDMLGRGLKLME